MSDWDLDHVPVFDLSDPVWGLNPNLSLFFSIFVTAPLS